MKWICKVCGYVHEGDTPPAVCPLCGADSSKFEPLEEKQAAPSPSGAAPSQAQWICKICGYVHTGGTPPDICPVCKADKTHFELLDSRRVFADAHRLGVARGVDSRVNAGLKALCQSACQAAGQALAMARAAEREGYPEAAALLRQISGEKAAHAARLYELLGEGITPETAQNLRLRVEAELAGCRDAKALSGQAGALGLEEIRAALADIARDGARHGRAVEGLLGRLFP